MGIYKIFPEKDSTIYSEFPTKNAGIDEIIEIGAYQGIDGNYYVSRGLIKFSQSDINNVLNNIVSGSFSVFLRLFLANLQETPSEFTIFTYPISQSWEMGLGRSSNSPITTEGVSWVSRSLSNKWNNTGSTYYNNIFSTQSFTYNDSKDLLIDVTSIVSQWTSSIENEGFILKFSSSLEYNSTSNVKLMYFSQDTHTIYPPCLEFKWNDVIYVTGSASIIDSSNIVINLINNKQTFNQNSIQKFKLNVRDKYPARVFQTSSVYLNYKLLPSSSYWAIRDMNTKEMVVDFDENYTKIGCDGTNNYFNIYMNGLEPERYYELLFKFNINNEIVVLDENYYFKVIK